MRKHPDCLFLFADFASTACGMGLDAESGGKEWSVSLETVLVMLAVAVQKGQLCTVGVSGCLLRSSRLTDGAARLAKHAYSQS